MKNLPVGVIDSGVGGLSVLKALRKELPHEDFLYCGDSKNSPWGDKSEDYIVQRTKTILSWMLEQKIKAFVIACNTATCVAEEALNKAFPTLPIVGIHPAVARAVKASKSNAVGILGTVRTVNSPHFTACLAKEKGDAMVYPQSCPGLMECVEACELQTEKTKKLLSRFLNPLLEKGVDTLALNCTHYPFLSEAILNVAGKSVTLIDPSDTVAENLRTVLKKKNLLNDKKKAGTEVFYFTGSEKISHTLTTLWGQSALFELTI